MRKKFVAFACVTALVASCAALFAGCSKQERENTIRFAGVHQSADGHLYADVENWDDFENVNMEYTFDGGESWHYFYHGNYDFSQTDKSFHSGILAVYDTELQAGQQLTVGLRLAETDEYLVSAPTEFINYTVKPVCGIASDFVAVGYLKTDPYATTEFEGVIPYELFQETDGNYYIKRYDYTKTDDGYSYSNPNDGWKNDDIDFEYMFVPVNQAFYGTTGSVYKTSLYEYYNAATDGAWTAYNKSLGIRSDAYFRHLQEDGGLISDSGDTKVFALLIRAAGTQTNLPSPCNSVLAVFSED